MQRYRVKIVCALIVCSTIVGVVYYGNTNNIYQAVPDIIAITAVAGIEKNANIKLIDALKLGLGYVYCRKLIYEVFRDNIDTKLYTAQEVIELSKLKAYSSFAQHINTSILILSETKTSEGYIYKLKVDYETYGSVNYTITIKLDGHSLTAVTVIVE